MAWQEAPSLFVRSPNPIDVTASHRVRGHLCLEALPISQTAIYLVTQGNWQYSEAILALSTPARIAYANVPQLKDKYLSARPIHRTDHLASFVAHWHLTCSGKSRIPSFHFLSSPYLRQDTIDIDKIPPTRHHLPRRDMAGGPRWVSSHYVTHDPDADMRWSSKKLFASSELPETQFPNMFAGPSQPRMRSHTSTL